MNVSDRRLQVQLTQEAKITPDFSLCRAILAFAGFASALTCASLGACTLLYRKTRAAQCAGILQNPENSLLEIAADAARRPQTRFHQSSGAAT